MALYEPYYQHQTTTAPQARPLLELPPEYYEPAPPDYGPELRRIADALEKLVALLEKADAEPVRSRRLGDNPDYVTEA